MKSPGDNVPVSLRKIEVCLEDREPLIRRMRRYAVTPPSWSSPSSATPTPSQPTPPEPVDEPVRDMEEPDIEELNPAQIDGGDDQPDGGEGHQRIDLSGRGNQT